MVALLSLGDQPWLLPCMSPLASLTPLLSAGAESCSGCKMLLGEAWADRLELGIALKLCHWQGDVTAGCRLTAPLFSHSWKQDCHCVSNWDMLESLA